MIVCGTIPVPSKDNTSWHVSEDEELSQGPTPRRGAMPKGWKMTLSVTMSQIGYKVPGIDHKHVHVSDTE